MQSETNKYSVVYSKVAIRDLDRVWNEVLETSKDYETAEKYIDGLMDKVEALTEYPRSGIPLYYEDAFIGYYYVVFKKYAAFYRIEDNAVLVDRVLFTTSDYKKILHLSKL